MRRSFCLPSCLVLALSVSGCDQDPFAYISRVDGGPASDSQAHDGDAEATDAVTDVSTDAIPDACVMTGAEVCDKLDNDCNGTVDDVDPATLESNPVHCGKCDNTCSYPNAFGKCVQGQCVLDKCAPGYYDTNSDATDGCEYACIVSNDGSEDCVPPVPDCVCDNVDNNCDGKVDEIFDKTTDLNNCGACGNKCVFNHATPTCVAGTCQMGACDDGYTDANGSPTDGCEYNCPIWPAVPGPDLCDNVDNDCDGQVDEDFASSACGPSLGECVAGATKCVGGAATCQGGTGPSAELCDNKDNDCDGQTDEDYDKQNDPRHCGQSCTDCTFPHAISNCVAAVCGIAVCEQGWINLDNQLANGCEYNCTITGVEICDGKDNDCNGLTDLNDPGMSVPTTGLCSDLGECAGATATCQGATGWTCNYGADVELTPCTTNADCLAVNCDTTAGVCPGELSLQETKCDDKDNNCNGLIDEAYSDKGVFCAEQGKTGICQGTGSMVCKADGSGTECSITAPGQPAKDELCNGLDDDCDNLVDEETDDPAGKGVVDNMVHINRDGHNFYIYRYEASRPDASVTAAGKLSARACSKSGVMPWGNLSYDEALAACLAAGKRLCSAQEWFVACSGAPANPSTCQSDSTPGCHYPYNTDQYNGSTCNGHDYNPSSDGPIATGAASGCVSNDGIHDMSGNLKEWTNDQKSTSPSAHTVRGGSYDNVWFGLRCDFTFAVMPDTFYYPNLGFRCCSDAAP